MLTCPECHASVAEELRECPACGRPFDGAERRIGNVVGTYHLIKLFGRGGMGWVYLAEHRRLGRKVALKMLRPELSANPRAVERFFSEARTVNQIAHENIQEISDFFENDGGDNYYISELLQGSDLRSLLQK